MGKGMWVPLAAVDRGANQDCWSADKVLIASNHLRLINIPKEDIVDMVVKVTTVGTVKIVESVLAVATVIVLKIVERAVTIQ